MQAHEKNETGIFRVKLLFFTLTSLHLQMETSENHREGVNVILASKEIQNKPSKGLVMSRVRKVHRDTFWFELAVINETD